MSRFCGKWGKGPGDLIVWCGRPEGHDGKHANTKEDKPERITWTESECLKPPVPFNPQSNVLTERCVVCGAPMMRGSPRMCWNMDCTHRPSWADRL